MSNEIVKRKIGRSDVECSAVGLGTWAIGGWMWGGADETESIAAINASIDAGISLIDTAPAYGMGYAEEVVGKAIVGRRDEVVLATKCGLVWHTQKGDYFFDQQDKPVHRYLAKDSIIYEVEQSLKRLRTDYIDLLFTHWQDATTSIEETMEAMLQLKKQGKIRAIGISNVDANHIRQYVAAGQLDSIQEQYSMVHRDIEKELIPMCQEQSISVMSYSSLSLGLLTGKMGPDRVFNGDDQRKDNPLFSLDNRKKVMQFVSAIQDVANDHSASIAQIVIAWTIQQPGITFSLCGARNVQQAVENAKAGSLKLNVEELALISKAVNMHLETLSK